MGAFWSLERVPESFRGSFFVFPHCVSWLLEAFLGPHRGPEIDPKRVCTRKKRSRPAADSNFFKLSRQTRCFPRFFDDFGPKKHVFPFYFFWFLVVCFQHSDCHETSYFTIRNAFSRFLDFRKFAQKLCKKCTNVSLRNIDCKTASLGPLKSIILLNIGMREIPETAKWSEKPVFRALNFWLFFGVAKKMRKRADEVPKTFPGR